MPPRKTSRPPPYAARQNRGGVQIPYQVRSLLRRERLRMIALVILSFLTFLWLIGRIGGESGSTAAAIIGTGPDVVIVTVLDPKADAGWIEKIKKNREDYAKRHGYLTFFPENDRYDLKNSPSSWAKVPAMRHAMTLNPSSAFFWYLESTTLIMEPSLPLTSHVLASSTLEKSMIVNQPVVPPDSVIKTFGNLKGDRIDLIITQDKDGLALSSFVVRNGEWAKYFLDAWFDPIYRSYNFQKADTHALEHIVQWHGTILAKLALVPQNQINAYVTGPANQENGQYRDGDLVANFPGCDKEKRNCADEMKPFFDIADRKARGLD
ncbi:glycosyltransferase family 34 protein [Sporormia fimetaria CBS 119925]|uniref:Glycosyltransferase family 34 protein n=1 Tax=Sporormia fimetaria CBS 119925 TaxID=1340428 RepID=A0A6A6UXE6_9PLEO|nr:glycosyltransferase family 34 protein [Sporormia fimetaria CBS 119925]